MITKEDQIRKIDDKIQYLQNQINDLLLWRENIVDIDKKLISNEINENFVCAAPIPFYKKISMLFIDTKIYTKEIKINKKL